MSLIVSNIVYCLSAGTSPNYAFQGIFKSTDAGVTFVNTGLTSDILENIFTVRIHLDDTNEYIDNEAMNPR